MIDPTKVLLSLERLNAAIDLIGIPDAGYKLWNHEKQKIVYQHDLVSINAINC